FPEGVWEYLNDPYPGSKTGETRKDHLINQWIRLGRIYPPNTNAGRQQAALLTGAVPMRRQISIDLLQDRTLMLSDLRAAISQMDREMLEIMRWVQSF
ncbi:MAG: hypothetical protein ACRD3W_30330, partial [Terriglobales bacterium]